MSEPKLISPMLDGFMLGAPISDHDGVRCYPAIKENSDNKYIVKVISVPASQVQLDALLLTGAYQDRGSAMDYFKSVADGVEAEATLLKKLAKLEGFLPYDEWQIVPMEDNHLGYDIYLISSYKRSLEKYLRRNTMTHLGAVNLGLDLCSALAVARRAGYLYADLKPANVFISDGKQYRIGDLGFLEIDSLKYTSLPSKYISEYTAPELKDALTTVNTTVDTYAVGMILYRIYNNGVLPQIEEDEPIAAPANADYELAEVILKAISVNPKDRYEDPMEMGRALVSYMQRNGVNDVPIVPPAATVEDVTEDVAQREDETIPTEADAEGVYSEQPAEESATVAEQTEESEEPEDSEEPEESEEPDEPEDPEELEKPEESEEPANEENTDDADFAQLMNPEPEKEPEVTPAKPEPAPKKKSKPKKKKKKKSKGSGLATLLIFVLLLLIGAVGFLLYNEYYLQAIDAIHVDSHRDEMTVILDTEIDNSLLTVTITDPDGKTMQSGVSNNQAHFEGLPSDTLYKIKVEIDGFHKIKGVANYGHSTPAETTITNITAKTGPEDGSVVLNFAVMGPTTDNWNVTYVTEGEEYKSLAFSGHTATITGLTVGSEYTFTLQPASDLYLVGENTITCAAASLVMAENLVVADYSEGSLTVTWDAPAGAAVESWAVRCYNNEGVDMTLTTQDTTAAFSGIDTGVEYTIEVLAAGMTEPARTRVSPDPVTLSNIQVDDSDISKLVVTWDYEGEISDSGWHVVYMVDGNRVPGIVEASGASAVIQPRIPGATYQITIRPANGISAFTNTVSYDCPNSPIYHNDKSRVTSEAIENRLYANLLVTPDKENWSYQDILKSDYTSTFTSGQKASLLLHLNQSFYTYSADITILYVFRNAEGKVINDLVAQTATNWSDMWDGANYRYCELNIPAIPTEPGEYTLYLYFNNLAASTISFTVTE